MAQTKIRSEQIEDTLDQDFAIESWNAPTLLNSWANYGKGFDTAGYMKDSLGVVHLRGLIGGGADDTIAFTLPSGYRPSGTIIQNVALADVAGGEVRIQTNGDVYMRISNSSWTSLSNVSFMT